MRNNMNPWHFNICCLPYHISDLQTLLSSTKINFDIIGICKSRIKPNKSPIDNINLQNYNIEHCTTKLLKVVFLYILRKTEFTS